MSVSINCSSIDGFKMDPTRKEIVGYLLAFQGVNLSEPLNPDITVFSPFDTGAEPSYSEAKLDTKTQLISCVGVMSLLTVPTSVGDPITISAHISKANAIQLREKIEKPLVTNTVTKLAWWICAFDENSKGWYEVSHPLDPVTVSGQVNARVDGKYMINVGEPEKIGDGLTIEVVQFSFTMIPAADATFHFHKGLSMKEKSAIPWGLKVGNGSAT